MPLLHDSTEAIIKTPYGDIPASGEVEWDIDDGSRPSIIKIPIPVEFADQFRTPGMAKTPVTFQLRDPYVENPNEQDIRGLFFIRIEPATLPQWRLAVFADQRYWWSWKHVQSWYNMRRVSSYFRIKDPSAQELQQVEPDLWYWSWSLQNANPGDADSGTPFTVGDIVKDLAKRTDAWMSSFVSGWPGHKINPRVYDNKVIPQSFVFNYPINICWEMLLAYAPEIKVYPNRLGQLVVDVRRSEGDENVITAAGPYIYGRGTVERSYRGAERPEYIDVLFPNEFEVRFNYTEPADITTTTAYAASERQMTMVLQWPDYESFGYVQGDWVPFSTAMSKWSSTLLDIDWPLCRALICPYNDFATQFDIFGGDITDADVGGRIDALQEHFRQSFRLPREWLERCISIKAERVAISSPETGARAKPRVYSDYFRKYTRRHTLKTWRGTGIHYYGTNVLCYPDDGLISSNIKEAPAKVDIVNRDLGVIHVNWQIDPLKLDEMLIPGRVSATAHPTEDFRQDGLPVTWDSIIADNADVSNLPAMQSGYKFAVILLCTPAAAPYHRVRIYPSEALGDAASNQDFNGPPMELYCDKETARWAWSDDAADAIAEKFGVKDGPGDVPESLLLNASALRGGAPLQEIAEAIARRAYWRLQDRRMGHAVFSRSGRAEPQGFIDRVSHKITEEGMLTTEIMYDEELPEIQLESMLSPGSRAILMRTAVHGTGT